MELAQRVGLFVLVAALAAVIELFLRGRRATRWWEYLTVLAGGGLGAALGVGIDAVTSSISPEYFALGKGLGFAPGLVRRAIVHGAQAGLGAGVLMTGLLLIFLGRMKLGPSRTVARLASSCGAIAAWSLSCSAITCFVTWLVLRPHPLSSDARFELVWWTHLGAYAGALVAFAFAVRRIRRLPRTMSPGFAEIA